MRTAEQRINRAGPLSPTYVEKPWGCEWIWAHTDMYVGKILEIKKGHQLSYQYHKRKTETIMVLSGRVKLTTEEGPVYLFPMDVFHITPNFRHRFKALANARVLEVSTPHLEDVVRLRDDYERE